MEHITTTDLDALWAEVSALEAQHAATQARVDALLAQPIPARPLTTRERMDALWAGVERLAAWNDRDEAELAAMRAEIDAMERGDA